MQHYETTKKPQSPNAEDIDNFINGLSSSESELREIISFLIEHRELEHDRELERLQAEADALLSKLKQNQMDRLQESITCFKDILALHKQLPEENDEQGD